MDGNLAPPFSAETSSVVSEGLQLHARDSFPARLQSDIHRQSTDANGGWAAWGNSAWTVEALQLTPDWAIFEQDGLLTLLGGPLSLSLRHEPVCAERALLRIVHFKVLPSGFGKIVLAPWSSVSSERNAISGLPEIVWAAYEAPAYNPAKEDIAVHVHASSIGELRPGMGLCGSFVQVSEMPPAPVPAQAQSQGKKQGLEMWW